MCVRGVCLVARDVGVGLSFAYGKYAFFCQSEFYKCDLLTFTHTYVCVRVCVSHREQSSSYFKVIIFFKQFPETKCESFAIVRVKVRLF